jgi:glycine/D-amino acid oxidase-like deaminating enzyme
MLPRARVGEELASDLYQGGAVVPGLGGLHAGLYHDGLLRAARKAGAMCFPWTPALRIEGERNAFTVHTARGQISARDVVVATNGYTRGLVPWLDRRLIPFDAFMIATEVLPPGTLERAIPGGKVAIDSNHNPFYIRPSPDRTRVLFGGLTGSVPQHLSAKARHLSRALGALVPDLAHAQIDTVWSGKCAATFDLFPHMGCHNGIFFAIGYCFVGVSMGTYLGTKVGQAVLGQREAATVFADRSFRTMPFYSGRPWFLPVVSKYWQALDSRNPAGALS